MRKLLVANRLNGLKRLLAVTLALTLMLGATGCGADTKEVKPEAIKGDVKLSVWGASEDQEVIKEICERFKAKYPEAHIEIDVNIESESTVKDTILNDVTEVADVYCYASDQIYELLGAGKLLCIDDYSDALHKFAEKSVEDVKTANSEGSINAATVDGKLYGFPRAGDNGFFLYYDSNAINLADTKDMDTLLAAAEKVGKKVGMTVASGWYNASFFYGAGFVTSRNAAGRTEIDWNGTSATGYTGVDVVQSMLKICAHPAFNAIPDGKITSEIETGEYCAIISGTWDANAIEQAFGANYGAKSLPTFTCAGNQLQMGDSAGFKFLGVNPECEQPDWAVALADFMSNEESQRLYFEMRQAGPTNINVAKSSDVKSNKAIAAVVEQNSAYGFVQLVGEDYWSPTCLFGEKIAKLKMDADDRLAIQAELDAFIEEIHNWQKQ